jgi:hypothetical protein
MMAWRRFTESDDGKTALDLCFSAFSEAPCEAAGLENALASPR